jgi:hypothetical protein
MFSFGLWVDMLSKAVGHKYIKRIPYQSKGKRRYRYIYKVTHSHQGRHAFDESHLQVGTAFSLSTKAGSEYHGHVVKVEGDQVSYRIDDGPEKGTVKTVSKQKLLAKLNDVHGIESKLSSERDKLRNQIKEAKKNKASDKQIARLESRLSRLGGEQEGEKTPRESQPRNVMEKRYTDAEKKVKDLMNKPREVYQAIQDASAEEVPYLFYEARKEYIKEDHPESVDDMIRELAGRMQRSGDGFLILIINEDVNQGVEGRYTAKTHDLFEGKLDSIKRKDLSARAVHLAKTAKDQESGSRRSPVSLATDQELADIHEHLVKDTTLTDREALERFRYGKNPENRDKTRATMIQEIRESRGEPASTSRTRYQQRNTSPAQSDIKNVNDLDKPNKRGSRPAEAREADKRLIKKLEDTIRNHPESHREQARTAMRLVTELKLAQSLKRYQNQHPTKGEAATKDNIYQIRRELRDRLQELTIGM